MYSIIWTEKTLVFCKWRGEAEAAFGDSRVAPPSLAWQADPVCARRVLRQFENQSDDYRKKILKENMICKTGTAEPATVWKLKKFARVLTLHFGAMGCYFWVNKGWEGNFTRKASHRAIS